MQVGTLLFLEQTGDQIMKFLTLLKGLVLVSPGERSERFEPFVIRHGMSGAKACRIMTTVRAYIEQPFPLAFRKVPLFLFAQ